MGQIPLGPHLRADQPTQLKEIISLYDLSVSTQTQPTNLGLGYS